MKAVDLVKIEKIIPIYISVCGSEKIENVSIYDLSGRLVHFQPNIHDNPVEDMLVVNPEDYMFSSARNYADLDFLLDVVVEPQQLITVK